MAIFESVSLFHNPRNPKCRACIYYGDSDEFEVSAYCTCTKNKIKRRYRDHNSPACTYFELKKIK